MVHASNPEKIKERNPKEKITLREPAPQLG